MIVYINGNIFNTKADVIAHCVNCRKIMGGGLALQIKNRYPIVYQKYCDIIDEKGPENCFGKSLIIRLEDISIANLFGQMDFGTDKRYLDYSALESAFNDLTRQMENHNFNTIAFPDLIGCGLAGGNREVILKMISKIFNSYLVEIWKYDPR
jgi:O-acetyl-ADP-ribose deacetylase (regulator of RNase III)